MTEKYVTTERFAVGDGHGTITHTRPWKDATTLREKVRWCSQVLKHNSREYQPSAFGLGILALMILGVVSGYIVNGFGGVSSSVMIGILVGAVIALIVFVLSKYVRGDTFLYVILAYYLVTYAWGVQ